MIESKEALPALYPPAKDRSVKKQLARLDKHCLRFIGLSPFVVLASGSKEGHFDASPRGGEPGFVKAPDSGTLLMPDAPGNNRLDTLENIIGSGRIGLLFLIPGVDETLRVNGKVRLSADPETLRRFSNEKRTPKLVSQVERAVLPTMGQMLNEQTGIQAPPETREQMVERYRADL